jgi:hypothetical protein
MASVAFVSSIPYRRLSLADVDAVVSARPGPTRIQGNAQPACFNRQVSMYVAKNVAGWSTKMIGRFYHGRDHSTVTHGIQRIEALRGSDPKVDELLCELKAQLERRGDGGGGKRYRQRAGRESGWQRDRRISRCYRETCVGSFEPTIKR